MRLVLSIAAILMFINCNNKSAPTEPITGFELDKYLGKWYEIARLDHRFERDMQKVTAEYSLREDGKVKVVNRGYKNEKWKKAVGKAKFAEDKKTGFLKVSFFGPFYGAYIIYELADDYSYAFVSGDNTGYLWFLSRTPTVSEELLNKFINQAKELGFNTDELIFVEQE
jgi:apolipoprotein D and lipocalin family protein